MPVSVYSANGTYNVNGTINENGTTFYGGTISTDRLLAEINAREVRYLYPVIVFYAVVLVIGVFGNALVLLVYTFRYKRSPARVYILFLASIDFSICLFGLPYHLMDLTHPYTFKNALLCKSLTFIVTTLFHMSIFGLIVIAVDRYLKICKPLGRIQLSYFGRKWACAAAFGLAVLLSWPNLVLYGRSEMEMDGVIGYACFIETAYLETNYPFVYVMSTLIVCTGSTVFLIAAYARICHQIYSRYEGVRFAVRFNKCAMDDISGTDEISVKSISGQSPADVTTLRDSCQRLFTGDDAYMNNNTVDDADSRMFSGSTGAAIDSTPSLDTALEIKPGPECYHRETVPLVNGSNLTIGSLHSQRSDSAKHTHSTLADESLCNLYLKSYSSLMDHTIQNNRDTCCYSEVEEAARARTRIKPNSSGLAYVCPHGQKETYPEQNSSASNQQSNDTVPSFIHKQVRALRGRVENRLSLPSQDAFPKFRSLGMCRSNSERFQNAVKPEKLWPSEHFRLPKSKSLSPSVEFKTDALRVHSGSIYAGTCMSVRRDKSNTASSRKHSKITKIMLTITMVFVLSYVPALVITIWCIVQPDLWDVISVRETVWFEFLLRFYLVNNICNPFIYGFWDSRFKKEAILTVTTIFKVCKVTQPRTNNGFSNSWE